ncbi:MAG: WYL domain-containing protein [Solirubrobacterales bacterium]|nr:WYL domain-containing protein [Solirubrobacterales bacterium]MCO5326818.1 WYL domain-containing protein [Solirubrobacterales bacterium]
MAKDTEKLIRQLSLISFLMANRRPVSALEIKQEVEGYSSMNEDAFARRFYADRAELESLGIALKVDRPSEGFLESELYALPPENYYLPAIKFTDQELAALATALSLLDGRFAYAEPLRLALQQVSWGRKSPLSGDENAPIEMAMTASAGGRELSQRLAKIETAISRRKTIQFSYYTMERDATADRKVDPYHLVFRSGQFYLIGYAHERDAVRVFRLSRIQGKVSYASKAEHDFNPPESFDRHDYGSRADWQMGSVSGTARIFLRDRIDWLVEREYGEYGEIGPARNGDSKNGKGSVFETEFASSRQLVAWLLGWRRHAKVLDPPELAAEADERLELLRSRHSSDFATAKPVGSPAVADAERRNRSNGKAETVIRPERFARLVTLAGMLIDSARNDRVLRTDDVCEELGITAKELAGDIDVLNVVNFGGGTYVLYAEVVGDVIEVDPEAYGDSFAKPARLLPLEAKALIAAIDFFGDHLPQEGLDTAREKIVAALGHDPSKEGLQITIERDEPEIVSAVNDAIAARQVLRIKYYKENEDEFTTREIEPYRLARGPEGWYVGCRDRKRDDVRHFRLDRTKEAEPTGETFEPDPDVEMRLGTQRWLSEGEVTDARVARVWVSPERARWVREERTVVEELADGALVIEMPFAGTSWLVREVLKGAGDMVVLEPDDAREAVLAAVSE